MNARQPKLHSEFKVHLDYITRLLFKLSETSQKNWGPVLFSKVRCRLGFLPLASQPVFSWGLAACASPSGPSHSLLTFKLDPPGLSHQVCVETWNLLNPSRLHLPRPSAVALEVQRLNALNLERKIGKSVLGKVWVMPVPEPRTHSSSPLIASSCRLAGLPLGMAWASQAARPTLQSLWQVHLAMVRYHEGGRFCEKNEEWDRESAIFHLEHAADLGELEAIVGLGLMYSQLPHHILADVSLKVRGCVEGSGSPSLTAPSLVVTYWGICFVCFFKTGPDYVSSVLELTL